MYKLTPILEPSFSFFWVRIFLKNVSFILEFSFRYPMVTWKICELFFISVFDPWISRGRFLDWFLGCERSTYTRVNTVLQLLPFFFLFFFCKLKEAVGYRKLVIFLGKTCSRQEWGSKEIFTSFFTYIFIFSEITNQRPVILALLICFFSEGEKLGNSIGGLIYSHGFVFEKTFQWLLPCKKSKTKQS